MSENIKMSTKTIRTPTSEIKHSKKEPQTFPKEKNAQQDYNVDEDIEFLMRQQSSSSKTTKQKKNKCPHSSIINEGGVDVCVDCGENIQVESFDTEWRYYGDGVKSK
jgi:hypothetical protein